MAGKLAVTWYMHMHIKKSKIGITVDRFNKKNSQHDNYPYTNWKCLKNQKIYSTKIAEIQVYASFISCSLYPHLVLAPCGYALGIFITIIHYLNYIPEYLKFENLVGIDHCYKK